MRTVVELSEKDIIQTIANAFDVDVNKVMLKCKEIWEGHGPNEYKRQSATATVVLNDGGASK